MSFYFQSLICISAFGITVMIAPDSQQFPFDSVEDFIQFKEDRRLMWCRIESELTENGELIRELPTCSFGGYYPSGPSAKL